MLKNYYWYAFVFFITFSLIGGIAHAQSAEEKGFSIAERSDKANRGFGDNSVDQEMILQDSNGQISKRILTTKILEVEGKDLGDKSISIFKSPADIEGLAVLSHAKILEPDDQWLYLPALKRVKRIAAANKSGSFAGSEFAYEDFTLELYKFNYKYLRSESCPNASDMTCDVIEYYPKYEHSGYTKMVGWVDQTAYQTRRIDFYDRKNARMKTLDFLDYKQYLSKFWRPQKMSMKNHLTGKSTDIIYSSYAFKTGLKDSDFVKDVLDRVQ